MIPFSKQSGIAEWCVNTMSVINYLIGTDTNEGAHQKYRPEDMTPARARDILRVCMNYKYFIIICIYLFIHFICVCKKSICLIFNWILYMLYFTIL